MQARVQPGRSRRSLSRAARLYVGARGRRAVHAAAASCFGLTLSAAGSAHINLVSPPPRQPGRPDSALLRPPCGQRQTERTEAVSVFRPGETIDVVAEVYVQHVSYFRIALDVDGDDSFSSRRSVPDDPRADDLQALPAGDGEVILDYVLDDSGDVDRIERRVTLPSITCDECTLQLIQFTYGLPVREGFYYQCADLTIAGEPIAGAADVEPDADEAPPVTSDPAATSGCSLASHAASRAPAAALAALLLCLAARRGQRSGRDSIQAPRSSR